MREKNYIIILILLTLINLAKAQDNKAIQFYISPYIGGEWTLSSFEYKKNRPPYISGTALDMSEKYGINLIADFKRKFSLELGYGWGNVGWGVSYKSQTDSAASEISGSSSSSITVRRLSIKLVKPIKAVKIKRNKKGGLIEKLTKVSDDTRYWAIFNISILGGMSYEYIPPFVSGELSISLSNGKGMNGTIPNDQIKRKDTWERVNPYGWGIFTGFSLQFYQFNKRRFELGFIYHKGLNKRIIAEWETSINGVEYPTFNTFTRGSMLSMYIAYPIPIFKIKRP